MDYLMSFIIALGYFKAYFALTVDSTSTRWIKYHSKYLHYSSSAKSLDFA